MAAFKINKFDQIGILVKSIEKAVDFYNSYFNFKGSINIVEQWSDVVYKQKNVRFKMKKVMQTINQIQFEIVELVESNGDHLYLDFLNQGNEGLHHLGIYTKEAQQIITEFKTKHDIDVIQTGKVGRVNFYYLDTRNIIGYFIELISF
jgi:catechol 2,3-dioxygenase-like lactoylglutathione lyase family enzyme